MVNIKDKVIVITSGTEGIEEVTVRRLVEEGARVLLTGPSVIEGIHLVEELGENISFIKHDISQAEDWKYVINKAREKYGKVDALVNYAGLSINELSTKSYLETLLINQHAVNYGMKMVKPVMDNACGGVIINFSSFIEPGITTVSRYSVRCMTKVESLVYTEENIKDHLICSGLYDMPFSGASQEEYMGVLEANIPLYDLDRPEEIVDFILLLTTDESKELVAEIS